MKTKKQMLTKALETLDYIKFDTLSTTKYECWWRPEDGDRRMWVGKKGALRSGRTVGESVSLTHLIPSIISLALAKREGK